MLETPADFFELTGPLPPSINDVRRFPRFFYRSVAEATIYPIGGAGEPVHCFILTRDLSRGGIGILHNTQLFPGQRLDVTLNGEPPRAAVVEWCQRRAKGVYSVGCRFVKSDV
jgi:hypothetical protein